MLLRKSREGRDRAPVLLAGAFGQGNPGDEALLTAFRRALADVSIVVASSDPADTERRHGVPAVASTAWRDVSRVVSDCAGVVFAGGTVFKTLPPSTGRSRNALLRNALAIAAFARAADKPVCMAGVGVGELDNAPSRVLARNLARQANLLVLRDAASARALARIGVPAPLRVGSDPAWTLLDKAPADDGRRDDTVVVVPSRWAANAVPVLAEALRPLLGAGHRVGIMPWQCDGSGHDDRRWAQALAAQLGGDIALLPPPVDLEDAAQKFADARLVVAARFHALVAAGAAGTPFLAVTHEHKLAAIADRLAQPMLPTDASADTARAAVRVALSTAPPSHAAVRAEVAAAEEAFGLLRLVLSRGTTSPEGISGLRLEPTW